MLNLFLFKKERERENIMLNEGAFIPDEQTPIKLLHH